jgi:hypothetical protein
MRSPRCRCLRPLVLLSSAVVLLAGACSHPPLGSMDDLSRQIDDLMLPASMVELDQAYVADCPATCPSLVRWYDVSAPAESIRPQLQSGIESAGISVNQVTASPGLFAARSEEHIFFFVLDAAMIAGNEHAPLGADVEISVQYSRTAGSRARGMPAHRGRDAENA